MECFQTKKDWRLVPIGQEGTQERFIFANSEPAATRAKSSLLSIVASPLKKKALNF